MPLQRPSFSFRRPLLMRSLTPNVWDVIVFGIVIGILVLIAVGGRQTLQPIAVANRIPISLDPRALPGYALRTTLRMFAALFVSLVVTFVFGAMAAKSRRAEMVIIPLIDVCQSVPVFGFLSFTVTGLMAIFPGSVLGEELAAIFAIFTSQAWNMVFSFYHSMKTIPRDLRDLSTALRLGAWRRFWTLEAPYAAPGLILNAMVSMSGAWFFVVISEAISVGAINVTLPGVGSYVAAAITQHDIKAIGWAVLTMALVILAYDQLLFRPLVAWAEKFRTEPAPANEPEPTSWMLDFMQRADLARRLWRPVQGFLGMLASFRLGRPVEVAPAITRAWSSPWADWIWYVVLGLAGLLGAWRAASYILAGVPVPEIGWTLLLGTFTLLRVVILTVAASVIWLPIGVWIGLRPRWAAAMQPVTQFLAAFPANILYPLVVAVIVKFRLLPDIWLSPLIMLGAQWYILFNVIAGARMLPGDLLEAAASMRIKGWTWWRKVILPGVLPSYVTGAVTAAGGAWNATVVSEVSNWGSTKVEAHGLGAYITDATSAGDLRRVALGVAVMVIYVVAFNRLVWDPLFTAAARRLRVE